MDSVAYKEMLATMEPDTLDHFFGEGDCPRPSDVFGEGQSEAFFRVTMLTGFLPDMGGPWLRHRKMFRRWSSPHYYFYEITGNNVLFSDWKWGFFALRRFFTSRFDGRSCVKLEYGHSDNGKILSKVSDELRTTSCDGVLLGRFYVCERFCGYFCLDRVRT